MPNDDRRLVYSTDGSLPLPKREKRKAPSPAAQSALPNDGIVRVLREKRRASSVTIIHGVPTADVERIGKELRRLCGTGGTTKNDAIELQGDHRDTVVAHLTAQGHRVKRAGG